MNSTLSPINTFDVNHYISAIDIFEKERNENDVYRIYGKLEYLSLLNGTKIGYTSLSDFFLNDLNTRLILDSFDFYLVRVKTFIELGGNRYIRNFEVIATPDEFELYDAGFAKNIFGDQEYSFNFTKDIDISGFTDYKTIPATELFLHPVYKLTTNGTTPPVTEKLKYLYWDDSDNPTGEPFTLNYVSRYSIGDIIYGDLISYSESNYEYRVLIDQSYQISTPYVDDNNANQRLCWRYNAFIPIRLRYLSSITSRVNSESSSYDERMKIPPYAINTYSTNYIWREILPEGVFDPMTGDGVDHPFINLRRYSFSSLNLNVVPDYSDPHTKNCI